MKRFDPSEFDNASTEDVDTSGCSAGYITNSDGTCTACTAGTYANTAADPQECTLCALDTYSGAEASECIACSTVGANLGTLETGSDSSVDCIGTCFSSLY